MSKLDAHSLRLERSRERHGNRLRSRQRRQAVAHMRGKTAESRSYGYLLVGSVTSKVDDVLRPEAGIHLDQLHEAANEQPGADEQTRRPAPSR